MITPLAQISLPYHTVHIATGDDGRIHCFKYDGTGCDFDIFEDQYEAADYIAERFPMMTYGVTVTTEYRKRK